MALAAPTSRGRRCVPPQPGMMPRLLSGWPNRARSDPMRMWQAIASSWPPPNATALMAAMTGLGHASILLKRFWPSLMNARASSASFTAPISWMSAPATNANSPAPVMMITLT